MFAWARKSVDALSGWVRGRRMAARSVLVIVPCARIMACTMSSAVMSSKSVPPVSKINLLVGLTLASSTATNFASASV